MSIDKLALGRSGRINAGRLEVSTLPVQISPRDAGYAVSIQPQIDPILGDIAIPPEVYLVMALRQRSDITRSTPLYLEPSIVYGIKNPAHRSFATDYLQKNYDLRPSNN